MISVLTGDIIGSQELSKAASGRLPQAIRAAARASGVGKSIEVFGGDSWQALGAPPAAAFSQAIALRANLLAYHQLDTRVSIGIGTAQNVDLKKISLSQGEAFVLSGRGLKAMPEDRRLTLHPSSDLPPELAAALEAATALLDGLTAGWSAKQAQAVALAQNDLPNYKLAAKFDPPISAQAFGKHLASAQWKLVRGALDSIGSALEQSLAKRDS